jgi:hypothetical protein
LKHKGYFLKSIAARFAGEYGPVQVEAYADNEESGGVCPASVTALYGANEFVCYLCLTNYKTY